MREKQPSQRFNPPEPFNGLYAAGMKALADTHRRAYNERTMQRTMASNSQRGEKTNVPNPNKPSIHAPSSESVHRRWARRWAAIFTRKQR